MILKCGVFSNPENAPNHYWGRYFSVYRKTRMPAPKHGKIQKTKKWPPSGGSNGISGIFETRSGAHLWATLGVGGASWGVGGASWGGGGASWGVELASVTPLGALVTPLGALVTPLGALLTHPGASVTPLGASVAPLGDAFWGV